MIEVRRTTAEHIPRLVELYLMVQAAHRKREPRIYTILSSKTVGALGESWIQEHNTEFWIGFLDGSPAGLALFRTHHRHATPFTFAMDYLEVDQLGTGPEAQGFGVGSALMRHAEQRAEDLGIADIRIGVRAVNEKGIQFYERLSYRTTHLRMVRGTSHSRVGSREGDSES
jgi:GNAT superfamily N-acetyltransferase